MHQLISSIGKCDRGVEGMTMCSYGEFLGPRHTKQSIMAAI